MYIYKWPNERKGALHNALARVKYLLVLDCWAIISFKSYCLSLLQCVSYIVREHKNDFCKLLQEKVNLSVSYYFFPFFRYSYY